MVLRDAGRRAKPGADATRQGRGGEDPRRAMGPWREREQGGIVQETEAAEQHTGAVAGNSRQDDGGPGERLTVARPQASSAKPINGPGR